MHLFIISLVSILVMGGIIIYLTIAHYKEKKDIFDRFMATDYHDYQYHKKEYQADVDHKKNEYEKMEGKKKTALEEEREKKAKGF